MLNYPIFYVVILFLFTGKKRVLNGNFSYVLDESLN